MEEEMNRVYAKVWLKDQDPHVGSFAHQIAEAVNDDATLSEGQRAVVEKVLQLAWKFEQRVPGTRPIGPLEIMQTVAFIQGCK